MQTPDPTHPEITVMIYQRLLRIAIALFLIIAAGVMGYRVIEHQHYSLFDALYMTVITMASVGFMEVHPLSWAGRVFTICLILVGCSVLVYAVSTVTAFIVEGDLSDVLRRRKMQKKIDQMRHHYLICGAAQTGEHIIDELHKTHKAFVVIDCDEEKVANLHERGIPAICGDATRDAVLLQAGVARARGLISTLQTDADNLFVTFTARHLNPALRIITKATTAESEPKLRQAGADGVVMTNFIGSLRMASELIRPSVVSFLDIMLRSKDETIRVDEIALHPASPVVGKTLAATGLMDHEGVSVVALMTQGGGEYLFNPARHLVLQPEHVLIVMGNVAHIDEIRQHIAPHGLTVHET